MIATNQLQADKLRDYNRQVQRERQRLLDSIRIDTDNPLYLQALMTKLVGKEAQAERATETQQTGGNHECAGLGCLGGVLFGCETVARRQDKTGSADWCRPCWCRLQDGKGGRGCRGSPRGSQRQHQPQLPAFDLAQADQTWRMLL